MGHFSTFATLVAVGLGWAEPPPAKAPAGGEVDIVIAGEIDKSSTPDRMTSWPSKLHALKLEKSKTYVIDMTGVGLNPFFRIDDSTGNPVGQAQNRGNANARLRFTPPKDDIYVIQASGQGAQEGKYSLSVKPYVIVPPKLFPFPAPAANKPGELEGKLSNDDSPDQYREFPGKVHLVELKAGKTYVIDMMSRNFDTYLLLQHENGAIIAQDDDSGGNLNSRIRFQPPATGRYRVVASTFNGQMGPFTLRIAEQP